MRNVLLLAALMCCTWRVNATTTETVCDLPGLQSLKLSAAGILTITELDGDRDIRKIVNTPMECLIDGR